MNTSKGFSSSFQSTYCQTFPSDCSGPSHQRSEHLHGVGIQERSLVAGYLSRIRHDRYHHCVGWRQPSFNRTSQTDHATWPSGDLRSDIWSYDFGVPQESVLGPVLFSVSVSPISRIMEFHGIRYHQYADDTRLYTDVCSLVPSQMEALTTCVGFDGFSTMGYN